MPLKRRHLLAAAAVLVVNSACTDGNGTARDTTKTRDESGASPVKPKPVPADAGPPTDEVLEVAEVDRFSDSAGTLMLRSKNRGLPGPNEPIDFDLAPFITQSFGPDGSKVSYYNFDVQPAQPAAIYVVFREGDDAPVEGQRSIIDYLPGSASYSDFWQVRRVIVSDEYVANTLRSLEDIAEARHKIEGTETIVNCPVVPEGSTATQRVGGGSAQLIAGWYRGKTVKYFTFSEAALSGSDVPTAPIFVMFKKNPGEDGGGPPSGMLTEENSAQTHNVLGVLPDNPDYSPLWSVNVLDNSAFAQVKDLETASAAEILVKNAALVNCPLATQE